MRTICLGKIIKTFGVNGAVCCKSETSFASTRFTRGRKLFLKNAKNGDEKEVEVASFRDSGDYYYLSFKDLENINLVKDYIGYTVEIDENEATLPEGYYHLFDLIGCKIINNEDSSEIGEVIDVMSFATKSTFKVKENNGKTCYIPFVMDEFVVSLDIEKKEIRINVIDGLL